MYSALNSPVIKGFRNIALGVAIWGVVMTLDGINAIPNDTYGKATQYAGLAAGALFMATGASKALIGE